MYFFTADEHYGHKNIIQYCNRPFVSAHEMDEVLICNHNAVVGNKDTVYHLGDFSFKTSPNRVQVIINRLNGNHVFLRGSHDKWMKSHKDTTFPYMIEFRKEDCDITLCHYCLRTWPRSHYNTWHLFGHSHGRLEPVGKAWDVGVDNNNYYPLSLRQIIDIMNDRPDNPNKLREGR